MELYLVFITLDLNRSCLNKEILFPERIGSPMIGQKLRYAIFILSSIILLVWFLRLIFPLAGLEWLVDLYDSKPYHHQKN